MQNYYTIQPTHEIARAVLAELRIENQKKRLKIARYERSKAHGKCRIALSKAAQQIVENIKNIRSDAATL